MTSPPIEKTCVYSRRKRLVPTTGYVAMLPACGCALIALSTNHNSKDTFDPIVLLNNRLEAPPSSGYSPFTHILLGCAKREHIVPTLLSEIASQGRGKGEVGVAANDICLEYSARTIAPDTCALSERRTPCCGIWQQTSISAITSSGSPEFSRPRTNV